MRVISQNGKSDIPYEHFAFSIVGNGSGYSIIATRNIAEPPEVVINSVIATYLTKEKVIKAMEMLREAYVGMPIVMQNVNTPKGAVKTLEVVQGCGIGNIVFRFPQDDEIEV